MSPEIKQLNDRIQILEVFVMSLTNAAQMEPLVTKTLTSVLSGTSAKTAGSATQAVDEAGAATYNVMKAPDGFVTIGGLNVPYIN